MNQPETCSTCRYWARNQAPATGVTPQQAEEINKTGACRRYPPVVVMGSWLGQPAALAAKPNMPPVVTYQINGFAAASPTMPETGWCGEYDRALAAYDA